MYDFRRLGATEVWICYGTGQTKRFIPLHDIANALGERRCRVTLKAHILSGSDITSKIESKASALKNEPERYLENFGETESLTDDILRAAEKYLVLLS